MDIISSSIISGLIYDTFKLGVTNYLTCVKVALKETILTENEKELISNDLNNTTEKDWIDKESLENFFKNSAKNTKEIITKNNKIVHNGTGDMYVNSQGDNSNITQTIIVNEKKKELEKKS